MEIDLSSCLNQCGLSQVQIDAIYHQGYVTMTDFSLNQYSNIDSFAKKLQALLTNRGGVNLGHMHFVGSRPFFIGSRTKFVMVLIYTMTMTKKKKKTPLFNVLSLRATIVNQKTHTINKWSRLWWPQVRILPGFEEVANVVSM